MHVYFIIFTAYAYIVIALFYIDIYIYIYKYIYTHTYIYNIYKTYITIIYIPILDENQL